MNSFRKSSSKAQARSKSTSSSFRSPLKSRMASLKRKLILTGIILAVWFAVNAVWSLRSQDISTTSLMENHKIVGENVWAIRWKYGWEKSSRTEKVEGSSEPATWRTWSVAGGGQLEVEFPPHQWTAQSFKARFDNPMSHTPLVLDGRAYKK